MSKQNKLSEELVNEIKKYYNEGNSCQKTANKFNVGKTTVRSYVDIRTKVVRTDVERKRDAVIAVSNRRRKVKQMAIDYKGGKCVCCGYKKSNAALEFHHLDQEDKDFSIAKKGHCTSWEKIKKELNKCILVCSNCHKEIHDEIYKFGYSEKINVL